MTEGHPLQRNMNCLECGASFAGKGNLARRKLCGQDCARADKRKRGPDRFWAKVEKTETCWLYMGFRKWDGYGWIARSEGGGKYRYMTAHRYAWILTHGKPPDGMHILHDCDNPPCCNPAHLRLGTHADNMADQRARGRHVHGERTRHKLTLEQVLEILANPPRLGIGGNVSDYAKRYGVKTNTITSILAGRTWKLKEKVSILHPDRVRPVRRQA